MQIIPADAIQSAPAIMYALNTINNKKELPMLKLSDDFYFKRKYFVKDLSDPTTYLDGAGLIFTTIKNFLRAYDEYAPYSFENVDKVVIEVKHKEDVEAALSINPQMRPFIILLMTNAVITQTLLDAFYPADRCAVGIVASDLIPAKNTIEKINNINSENFKAFQSSTYGYIFTTIENVDTIIDRYSEGFIADPFWCIVHADWEYGGFGKDLRLEHLSQIIYQCRFIADNMIKRTAVSPATGSSYAYDYYRSKSRKEIAIYDRSISFMTHTSPTDTRVYFSDIPKTQKEIASIRKFYDTRLPVPSDHFSLATPVQNFDATGSPASTPEWLYLIEDALRGGRK